MYLRIENDFNEKSMTRKHQLIFVMGVFAYAMAIALLVYFYLYRNIKDTVFIILLIISTLVFYLGCYIVIIIKVSRFEKITFAKIIDYDKMINSYHEIIHDEDIKILKKVLEENSVNTRPKVLEALRHYQALLPKRITGSSQLVSILALAISTIALVFSETVNSIASMRIILLIIILVISAYIFIQIIEKDFFKFFGKNALYERMEASISEIYMNYNKKEEK